jgi:PncC family amidohydrolase
VDAVQAKNLFVASASHELRAPLQAITLALARLGQGPLDEAQRQLWQMAQQASATLVQLIDDVLDLAHYESGRLTLHPAPVALAPLLQQIVEPHRLAAQARGLVLQLQLSPALPAQASLDALRLRQLLANLVGNAVKYTPAGQVLVSAVLDDEAPADGAAPVGNGWLRLTVQDTGVGIPPERQAQLFTPFGSPHAATPLPAGERSHGLGLAICKRLAEAMQGEISLRSQPGQGTEVVVRLPLLAAPGVAAAQADAPGTGPSGLVLLVDDDALSRLLLAELLRSAGYGVLEAADADEALLQWRSQPVAAVVSDRHMPGSDGPTLLHRIADDARSAGRPLPLRVLCTGHPGDAVALGVDALGVGDDCALLQPTAGHAAGGVQRHAGGGPALPVHRGARAAGPQGAGRQPERSGRLWRAAGGLHAGAGAAARRRGLPRAWPRGCSRWPTARHRTGRRRHHRRPAEPVHHRDWRGPAGPGAAAQRRAAGDDLWVSGTLGDARLALEVFRGTVSLAGEPISRPCAGHGAAAAAGGAGPGLRGLASSAIDVSDGLLGDLGHVLQRSGVGAEIELADLPRSPVLASPGRCSSNAVPAGRRRRLRAAVHRAAPAPQCRPQRPAGVGVRCIGRIERGDPGLRLLDGQGRRRCRCSCRASTTSRRARTAASGQRRSPPRRATARFMLRTRRTGWRWASAAACRPWRRAPVGTLWAWAAFVVLDPAGWTTAQWGWVIAASPGWAGGPARARPSTWARPTPAAIVWDEVVAFWLVLWLLMPVGLLGQAVAFGLFRFFDAAKPGPVAGPTGFKLRPGQTIGWRQGWGILFDDLVAALCTLLVIALWLRLTLEDCPRNPMSDPIPPWWPPGRCAAGSAARCMATAESCTGGLIAAACTDLAGSSDWFERGFVTYSNAAKTELLGVPAALIAAHGAVSEPVARPWRGRAARARTRAAAVAVTGVAGPGGGTATKPVGLVWLAWAQRAADGSITNRARAQHFPGDRAAVRQATIACALQGLLDDLGAATP